MDTLILQPTTSTQVDPETHKPPAEDAAKAYLWLSATAKRSRDLAALAATAQSLTRLRDIIPTTWFAALDDKVAKHLAEHTTPATALIRGPSETPSHP